VASQADAPLLAGWEPTRRSSPAILHAPLLAVWESARCSSSAIFPRVLASSVSPRAAPRRRRGGDAPQHGTTVPRPSCLCHAASHGGEARQGTTRQLFFLLSVFQVFTEDIVTIACSRLVILAFYFTAH
jgi:hypothetical protein